MDEKKKSRWEKGWGPERSLWKRTFRLRHYLQLREVKHDGRSDPCKTNSKWEGPEARKVLGPLSREKLFKIPFKFKRSVTGRCKTVTSSMILETRGAAGKAPPLRPWFLSEPRQPEAVAIWLALSLFQWHAASSSTLSWLCFFISLFHIL